jgi:predicted nucleic acid-binding protein
MAIELPDGADCFIDANILAYHFTDGEGLGEACSGFIRRVGLEEIRAFVSVPVLADSLHRVMLAEVRDRHRLDRVGLVGWIHRHRDCLGELTETIQACEQLERLPLHVLPVDVALLTEAMRGSVDHHLLTGDAVIVALMRRHGITNLVTNDDDFDRVPGLTVWKPR